ncbi:MAG: alanine dehydrogenase, partial [Tissierella sp.]|nr:alanine dehydrogenase [Tissierella sp.]
LESEYGYFKKDLIIFTFLHLAAEPELTKALLESGAIAIAYETVQLPNRSLPLLTPMSEVAGRMAVQQGSIYLEKTRGGKGKLIDGVPGVPPAHVVVVGAGIVGTGAIRRAVGLGARVTVLDIDVDRLRYLGEVFMGQIETLYSNNYNMKQAIKTADLVVGAVLIPGSKAPKLVTEEMVKLMEPGSVIVDVAIDQGGCVATIDKPTTHENPTFIKHGVVHYAVANIPGAVAQTSTLALTNNTLPYVMRIANKGWKQALKDDPALAKGANIVNGKVTYKAVSDTFDLEFTSIEDFLI